MKMLPCPYTCFFLSFKPLSLRCDQGSRIFICSFRIGFHTLKVRISFYIHKSHISLIRLRDLVQNPEDPFGTCKSHDYCIELLAYLVYRHVDALVKRKKACQVSYGKCKKSRAMIEYKYASGHSTQYITQIPKLGIYRPQHINVLVGFFCTFIQRVIKLVKPFHIYLFAVKDLNDFLAFHHFLNKSVKASELLLLFYKVSAAASCNFACHDYLHRYHDKAHTGQYGA